MQRPAIDKPIPHAWPVEGGRKGHIQEDHMPRQKHLPQEADGAEEEECPTIDFFLIIFHFIIAPSGQDRQGYSHYEPLDRR